MTIDTLARPATAANFAAGAPARLLEFDHGRFVALPVHTTIELIERPAIVGVPGAPYYMPGTLRWQAQQIVLLDLCALLNAHPKAGAAPARHALVVAYQTAAGQPIRYAAIATASLPQTLQISDASQCALPQDSDLWPLIALSCFEHEGRRVPIIDTGRLFATRWD